MCTTAVSVVFGLLDNEEKVAKVNIGLYLPKLVHSQRDTEESLSFGGSSSIGCGGDGSSW